MANGPTITESPAPRWLRAWAVVTACAALPLVLLGAEVTSRGVGMVDPVAVRTPYHLFTIPVPELLDRGLGYLIEHGHRTVGWLVGLCAIVLAVGLWTQARHARVRWIGVIALVAVSLQGMLGIFRVRFHALAGPNLAMVHGLFAQLVVATLIGAAVVLSRGWWRGRPAGDVRLRKLSLVVSALVFVQIAFGGWIRHLHSPIAQRLHTALAFVVVLCVAELCRRAVRDCDAPRRTAWLLASLLVVQVLLGVEAWIGRFGAGVPVETLVPSALVDFARSLHYVVGTLLFSASVAMALLAHRPAAAQAELSNASAECSGPGPAAYDGRTPSVRPVGGIA